MTTYVLPQVQVFQEFSSTTQSAIPPLPALNAGGHAKLIRYSEEDEKVLGYLGQYNPNSEEAYLWPERPAGAVVDQSYTKLFIDDALLRYYDSSDSDVGDTITLVSGYANRIRSASTSFAAHGIDYPHDTDALLDRGVKVGDAVRVRATVGGDDFELCTYVTGFVGETIGAGIGTPPTADDNNAPAKTASQSILKTGGVDNCVLAAIANISTYNGLAGGEVEEVYVVTVISGSVDGDATTATLRVRSASGTDDVDDVVPGQFGDVTEIGTRGVLLRITNGDGDCSISVDAEQDYSPDDLIAGQEWTVTARQTYAVPSVFDGGTYTGTKDDTYIVEITRGKSSSLNPQFSVRTTRGLDVSGPTVVSSLATNYPVGSKGVTVRFGSLNLCKGDKWYIPVVAATTGEYRTLVLAHNLADEVVDAEPNLVLELYIRKNIQVSANRTGAAPLTNWEQSATELTIMSGITAYDSTWTDGGTPVALTVHTRCGYSKMYVEVRYWLSTLAGKVTEVGTLSELDDLVSGPTHPDNPLKYSALKGLQNSNGTPVSLTAVCNPDDLDEWVNALEILDGRTGIYSLVPLSKDPAVWSLFQAHVETQSSPENGRWRSLWLNGESPFEKAIVDETLSSDEEVVLAIVEDDPQTSGTQYTQLRVPAHNSKFVTNGVRAGDVVRIEYNGDGFGGVSYTELIVDAVINEDTLRLASGLDSPISVAEKVEVWRSLSATEQAEELAKTVGFSDRRVRYVWPDTINADGYTVQGYYLCAALAGLASGVVPHQGLTQLEISGFTSVPRTTELFSRANLNTMAGGGVWIVTQDPGTGKIYTRHALTTSDVDTVDQKEEMVTRNLDAISYFMLDRLSPYIGIANVTPKMLDLLGAEMDSALAFLGSNNPVSRLGPQVIEGTVRELRAHATQRDRIVIGVDLVLPAPLNNIDLTLTLVA